MIAVIDQSAVSYPYNGSSPQQVILDGTQSQDSGGLTIASSQCLLTQFEWVLVSKPSGASDPSIGFTGNFGEVATVTIPAGIEGGFLYLLRVYEGASSTSPTLSQTPNSALCSISFKSENVGLHVLPQGERNHGDRDNENIVNLDNTIGSLQTTVSALSATPTASASVLGKSKLNEANVANIGDPAQPQTVNGDGTSWRTLALGGVATGMHTHPEYVTSSPSGGVTGRHHDLRPDLLTGTYDKVWSGAGSVWQSATPMLGSLTNSIIPTPARHASQDQNLLIDTYNDQSTLANQRALTVVKLQELGSLSQTDDLWAVVDLRLNPVTLPANTSSGLDNATGVGVDYEAMFVAEFYDSSDSSRSPLFEVYGGNNAQATAPADIASAVSLASSQNSTVAVGWTMSEWTSRASDFGTHPLNNTFNGIAGESLPVLTKQLSQGSMCSEALFGVQLKDGIARTYISLSNGGWLAIGNPLTLSSTFDSVRFYLAGTSGNANLGLRMETSALRVVQFAQDNYGLYPPYTSDSSSS